MHLSRDEQMQYTQLQLDAFRYQVGEEVYPHSNLWGDFNFSLDGVLEFRIDQKKYFSPPLYAIWIPPHVTHQAISKYTEHTHFICFRIAPLLCQQLAKAPKIIQISPFISMLTQQILNTHAQGTMQHWHKLQVLFDELSNAPCSDHYLPLSYDTTLQPILDFMLQADHHALKLSAICKIFAISERHLLRLSQQQLHMSISEWRNRAKLLYAMDGLKAGYAVKKIAMDLGYQHPSAFIEFFKRYAHLTPAQFRYQ